MLLAQAIERAINAIDDGQDLAGIDIGQAPGDQDGLLILGDEALDEMLGQDLDICLHCFDARVAGFRQPAPETIDRPDVAEPCLLLEDGVCLSDDVERLRVEQ